MRMLAKLQEIKGNQQKITGNHMKSKEATDTLEYLCKLYAYLRHSLRYGAVCGVHLRDSMGSGALRARI